MWSSIAWSMSSSGCCLGRAKTAKPKLRSASTQRCRLPTTGGMLAKTQASTSGASGAAGSPAPSTNQAAIADRKSVVEGKRVGLGGARIIKKKKEKIEQTESD